MAKESISRNEYLQLIGLFTLAARYERQLNDTALAVSDLLEPEREKKTEVSSHVSDEIYGRSDPSVDRLLENMGVRVQAEVQS